MYFIWHIDKISRWTSKVNLDLVTTDEKGTFQYSNDPQLVLCLRHRVL